MSGLYHIFFDLSRGLTNYFLWWKMCDSNASSSPQTTRATITPHSPYCGTNVDPTSEPSSPPISLVACYEMAISQAVNNCNPTLQCMAAQIGFEPMNAGVKVLCLAAWLLGYIDNTFIQSTCRDK